jgi:hypothetical protein
MQELGRLVLVMGLILVLIGGLLLLSGRIPWLGRLPGDILIQRRNFTFYFPLATGILISIVLTLLLWLVSRR